MIEYVDQVLSGQVLAGQKIKWACERFKRDLNRSKDDSFPRSTTTKTKRHRRSNLSN
ncbi:prophage P2b protein 15, terminase large subunit [Lactiplantibacillus plantarum]|nr:prophage P2b protein 15, terminase large subunit [Lactiplantibacillus plantarum]